MTLLMCISSKCWLWIFSRLLQDQLQRAINNFPSNWLRLWKIRTIYRVLNILWSVLCIKIQLRDQSDEPWNALLFLCRRCMFVLFLCVEAMTLAESWIWMYEEHVFFDTWLLCDLLYSYIWLKCTVCNLLTMRPHSIVCISCLPFVVHDEMHFELCLHSVYGGKKRWLFFTISMLKMWLLWIICIHCICCTAMDDISFWNKPVHPTKKSMPECCGFHFHK